MKIFHIPTEFEWDRGNSGKSSRKHNVSDAECEEVFFDQEKRILRDTLHSGEEERHLTIGKTKGGRMLFVVFTIRKEKVRIISARDLNKGEFYLYGKKA